MVEMQGRLPAHLVKPERLHEAIYTIRQKLKTSSGQFVSHNELSYYYNNRLTLAVHNDRGIVINVKVPVHFGPARMKLYPVQSYPVPHGNGSDHGFTIIDKLPAYVAFSADNEYVLEMTDEQVADCLPHNCHNAYPLTTVNEDSCIMSIFLSKHVSIVNNCHITYRGYSPFPSMATDLTHGHFLVASRRGWTATCHGVPPRELESCDLCLISLSCGCSLHSRSVTVLPSFSHCGRVEGALYKISYPYNSVILHAFFSKSPYHELSSDQLLISPLNLSLPRAIPMTDHSVDIPYQMQLNKLKELMSSMKSVSGGRMEKVDETLFERSTPWVLICSIAASALAALIALILIVRQRIQINTMMVSITALESLPCTTGIPLLDKNYEAPEFDFERFQGMVQNWLMVVICLLTILCAYRLVIIVYECFRRRALIHSVRSVVARSTIVMTMENEEDRLVLPVITLPMPPGQFTIDAVSPRSLRVQNHCCSAQLLIDWGSIKPFLYHRSMPISLPSMISVPFTRSRRLNNIINRPYVSAIRLYYDDVIYTIKECTPQEPTTEI